MIHFGRLNHLIKILAISSVLGTIAAGDSRACTTFSFMSGGGTFVAKNYDWDKESGIVYVNKRGVSKQSLKVFPSDKTLSWTSQFGSVTFNQYGRELPNAGINEAGLVVEVMELGESRFELDGSAPSVNESQWVQYMLDKAATVADVRQLARRIRISKILVPLHYMICDKTGACLAVEMLNGRLSITDQKDPATQVLTNHAYLESRSYLAQFEGFGGRVPVPSGSGSLERFVRAAHFVKAYNSRETMDAASAGFEGLRSVQTPMTQWSIVYDIDGKKIAFKSRSSSNLKVVSIDSFDFSCATPVLALPILTQSDGDVTQHFTDYRDDVNRELVRRSLAGSVPQQLIDAAANLPSATSCDRSFAH